MIAFVTAVALLLLIRDNGLLQAACFHGNFIESSFSFKAHLGLNGNREREGADDSRYEWNSSDSETRGKSLPVKGIIITLMPLFRHLNQ